MVFGFFFFSSRRRHTRLQGDWSSDVCSSDLNGVASASGSPAVRSTIAIGNATLAVCAQAAYSVGCGGCSRSENGRAAGRGRGEISGGGGSFKKKKDD